MRILCKKCKESTALDKSDICSICLSDFLEKNEQDRFLKLKYDNYSREKMIEFLSIKTDYENKYSFINRLIFALFLGSFPVLGIIYKLGEKLNATMFVAIILTILTMDKYIKDAYCELKVDLYIENNSKNSNKFFNKINALPEFIIRMIQFIMGSCVISMGYTVLIRYIFF